VSVNTEQEDDNLNNLKMIENTDVYVYDDHTIILYVLERTSPINNTKSFDHYCKRYLLWEL